MSTTLGRVLAACCVLLGAGCDSKDDSHPPALSDTRPNSADASMDLVRDARGDTGDDITDASTDRTMTTRALLPTSVSSLLLDPFITSDTAWGHFRVVVPAVDPAEAGGDCPLVTREFLSASPIGISAPVVLVNPDVLPARTGCTAIIAPFPGSTEPVEAQIWVALSDASGSPLSFPPVTEAGPGDIDAFVTVALLPNEVPSGTSPPASYPFALANEPPTLIAGRPWGRLELVTPVAIPEGGWFAITLTQPATGALYLAAPQIVPMTATALSVVRRLGAAVRSRPATQTERGAMLQYGRLLPPPPAPRRRHRLKRTDGLGP